MSEARLSWLEGRFDRRDEPGAAATPAATVVALRDGGGGVEALLLQRVRSGAFKGMWVFPGGKVERGDTAAPVRRPEDPEGPAGAEVAAARRAAAREAAEEAGLVLDPAALVAHAFWLPPPEAPRRFATWFFVAEATAEAAVVVERAEVSEHRWVRPADALAERDAGRLALAPPTWVTLWQLREATDPAGAVRAAIDLCPGRFVTRLATAGEDSALLWEGDAGYEDGVLDRPGPRRRLWVSESAPWRAELPDAPAGG